MKQTLNKYFIDWEDYYFGFGYGTGEQYTLKSIKDFFELLNDSSYDHKKITEKLGGEVTWLLINLLAHADIIEYGTSPRHGWLSIKGERLKEYLKDKSVDSLYNLITNADFMEDQTLGCTKEFCNCGEEQDCTSGCKYNPFFNDNPKEIK